MKNEATRTVVAHVVFALSLSGWLHVDESKHETCLQSRLTNTTPFDNPAWSVPSSEDSVLGVFNPAILAEAVKVEGSATWEEKREWCV